MKNENNNLNDHLDFLLSVSILTHQFRAEQMTICEWSAFLAPKQSHHPQRRHNPHIQTGQPSEQRILKADRKVGKFIVDAVRILQPIEKPKFSIMILFKIN